MPKRKTVTTETSSAANAPAGMPKTRPPQEKAPSAGTNHSAGKKGKQQKSTNQNVPAPRDGQKHQTPQASTKPEERQNPMTATATKTDMPTIQLLDGMPGFADLRNFALVSMDDDGLLYNFQSLEEPDVRFLVVPSAPFFPEYTPEIDNQSADRLGLNNEQDALLLLVVNVGDKPQDATANLMAPIVVNKANQSAAQVVLTGSEHPIRANLANEQ